MKRPDQASPIRRFLRAAPHTLPAMALALCLVASAGTALAAERARPVVTTATYPGADAVVLRLDVQSSVEESGRSTRIEHGAVKLLTPAGVRRYSVMRFDYDPETSSIEVLSVRVVRPDGTTRKADLASVADLPTPKHGIYWPFRMKMVTLADLAPGDELEWVTRFEGFRIAYLDESERFVPPQRGEYFDMVVFGSDLPVVEQVHRVDMPAGKPLYYGTYGGPLEVTVRADGAGGTTYRFRAEDLPAYSPVPSSPPLQDVAPRLVLATLPSWREKSRWVYLVNEPSFAVTPEIKALADRLTRGLATDVERMTALNRWVAHAIRYSGLSMGQGEGYTIHPASMTLSDRSGVCKDKAGMLVALMRAAGYAETFTAITSAGSRVDEIAADQFNHAVVAWRRPGGGYLLLDPTWAPLSRDLWSKAEAGQHYLVGTPAGDELAVTPSSRAEDNLLDVRIRERISADGALTGTVRISALGAPEDSLRRTFGMRPVQFWNETAANLVATFAPSAAVAPLELAPARVLDLDEPLDLEIAYSDPAAMPLPPSTGTSSAAQEGKPQTTAASSLVAYHPAAFTLFLDDPRMADHLAPRTLTGRKIPLATRSARMLRYEQETVLPREARLVGWKDVDVSTPQGSVRVTARIDGRKLVIDSQLVFPNRFVPAGSLPDFEPVHAAASALRTTWLVLDFSEVP